MQLKVSWNLLNPKVMQVPMNKGTYVSAHFSDSTLNQLEKFQKELGLLNPVPREKLHCTICYSRVGIPYKPLNNYYAGISGELEIWDTKYGRTLVLKLNSDQLKERHDYSMILGATYDFPEYIPHITLSYNLGGQKINVENDIYIDMFVDHEHVDELDDNWSDDK